MRKLRLWILNYLIRSCNWQVVNFEVAFRTGCYQMHVSMTQCKGWFWRGSFGSAYLPSSQLPRLLFSAICPCTHPWDSMELNCDLPFLPYLDQSPSSLQWESKVKQITKSLLMESWLIICFPLIIAGQHPSQPEPKSLYPSHLSLSIFPPVHRGDWQPEAHILQSLLCSKLLSNEKLMV